MIGFLFMLALIGVGAYYIFGPKKVAGTISALYDEVKVTPSVNPPGVGANPGDELMIPQFTY